VKFQIPSKIKYLACGKKQFQDYGFETGLITNFKFFFTNEANFS
jgi:hypothetical protein